MHLSDAQWRFVVEELLGSRAARCEALVARIAAQYPEHARAEALARSLLPHAILTGASAAALEGSLPRTLVLALAEQRATLRRQTMLRACMWRLDDPRYFERPEWARRALLAESSATELAARTAARFSLRFSVVGAARRATRWLGRSACRVAAGSAGAIFDAIEHTRFAERTRVERDARRERDHELRELARSGRVVPLPVRRIGEH